MINVEIGQKRQYSGIDLIQIDVTLWSEVIDAKTVSQEDQVRQGVVASSNY